MPVAPLRNRQGVLSPVLKGIIICVRGWVGGCVCACVRACVHACMHVCVMFNGESLNFSLLPWHYDIDLELFYSLNFGIIAFGSVGQHSHARIRMMLGSGHCPMVSPFSVVDYVTAEVLRAFQPKNFA